MTLRACTLGLARKREAAFFQIQQLFQGCKTGLQQRLILGRALLAGRLRRAGTVGQRGAFLVHQGVILLDEFGQFGRARLQIIERVHAANDGIQRLVGCGTQGLDVERARGHGRFQTRAETLVERRVGFSRRSMYGLAASFVT